MLNKMLFLILVIFLHKSTFPQINEEIKTSSDANSSGYYDEYEISDIDGCFYGLDLLFDMVFLSYDLIYWGHHRAMGRADSNKRIKSFDFEVRAGRANPRYWAIVPRISFNYGVFASELRLYQSFEDYKFRDDNYATLDWQLIRFNLLNIEPVNWKIGTGFMYEYYSSSFFNEYSTNLDIFPNSKIELNLAYRITPDFDTDIIVRSEVSGSINYVFKKRKRSDFMFFINLMHANYYETTDFNLYSAGIKIRLMY